MKETEFEEVDTDISQCVFFFMLIVLVDFLFPFLLYIMYCRNTASDKRNDKLLRGSNDVLDYILSLSDDEQRIILLVGPSLIGKSTICEHKDIKDKYTICSADKFRKSNKKTKQEYHDKCKAEAVINLAIGKSVIIDNTNLLNIDREPYIQLGEICNLKTDIIPISEDLWLTNDEQDLELTITELCERGRKRDSGFIEQEPLIRRKLNIVRLQYRSYRLRGKTIEDWLYNIDCKIPKKEKAHGLTYERVHGTRIYGGLYYNNVNTKEATFAYIRTKVEEKRTNYDEVLDIIMRNIKLNGMSFPYLILSIKEINIQSKINQSKIMNLIKNDTLTEIMKTEINKLKNSIPDVDGNWSEADDFKIQLYAKAQTGIKPKLEPYSLMIEKDY